ncbi:MAG TPA: hypothetical protein RMH99_07655 [Sandaracinaceae bacterium LLY-WYZ-13_1]|nr:hypothetical protein [Sandaracinaceae bacterium LLY-WYZ-13_1]
MHRTLASLGVALALFSVAATARAQDDRQLDEAARLTFESAREAFIAGDYETALARFRQAYELSARPGLLYNIAQTLDRLRRDEETVEALRAYLEAMPDAPNRAEVESRIRVIESNMVERGDDEDPDASDAETEEATTASTGAGASSAPPPEDEGGGGLHPAFFLSAGGLALAGGGLTVWAGLETVDRNDLYTNAPAGTPAGEVQALYDDALTYQTLTNVFIATTATFGAAAVVLAIFTDWDAFGGDDESVADLRLRPLFAATPQGVLGGLGGTF